MARLTKATLISLIRSAVEEDGWVVTPLSAPKKHPFRFEMAKGSVRHRVRAYIWNMTHGGGAKRPPNEYRIQITKVNGSDDGRRPQLSNGVNMSFGEIVLLAARKVNDFATILYPRRNLCQRGLNQIPCT